MTVAEFEPNSATAREAKKRLLALTANSGTGRRQHLVLLVGQPVSGKYIDNAYQTRGTCIAVPYRGIKLGLSQKPLAAFL